MEPTPTPENGRQSRGLARFWPVHGMPVPVQRQSDEEPGVQADGRPAGSAGPDTAAQQNGDSAAQRTDGPPIGHPGAQQMNDPHAQQLNGFMQSGPQGSVAPGQGFSGAAAVGQGFPGQADRQEGPREPAGFGSATQAHPTLTGDTQMVALGSRRGVFGDAQGDDPVGELPPVNGAVRGWTGNQPGYAPVDNDRALPGHRNGDAPRHGSVPGSAPVNGLPMPTPNRLPPAVSPAVPPTGTSPVHPVSPAVTATGTSPVHPVSPAVTATGTSPVRPVSSGGSPVRPVSGGGSPVPPASSAAPISPAQGAALQAAPMPVTPMPATSPHAVPQQVSPAPVMSTSPRPVSSLPVPVPVPVQVPTPHPANGGPIGLRSGEPPAADPRPAEAHATDARAADARATDARAADPGTDLPRQGGSTERVDATDPADLPRWAGTVAGGADQRNGSGAGRRSRDSDGYDARPDDSAVVTRRANTPDDAQALPGDRAAIGREQDEPADEQPLRPGDVAQTRITLWDDEATRQFHDEWHEVKAQFVDDPVAALTRAHDLLTEAVHELTESLLAERDDLDPLRRTSTPDTESMRMAMRGYREFLDRILAL
jgi:hypothetical protein